MAAAVTHQIPPFSLAQGPRIRPPRMLKGTPSPNTDPQPRGPVPTSRVWVQGKWRDLRSNAARDRQRIHSRQVEKAVRHPTLGVNIYAYSHIRTNQVVYSLTRILQNSNVLHQLLYHGKKTVPESTRRDMWTPYFSLHFPQTAAGAQSGLVAYQQLRELAVRRQLSPPKDLLMTTQADVDKFKNDRGDLLDVTERIRNHEIKMPNLNQMLPKKLRAKKLMDQRSTSVADLAFVLDLYQKSIHPELRLHRNFVRVGEKYKEMSQRAKKRLRAIRAKEDEKIGELEARSAKTVRVDRNAGQLRLDIHTLRRLSMASHGIILHYGQIRNFEDPVKVDKTLKSAGLSLQTSSAIVETINRRGLLSKNIMAHHTKEWRKQHRDQPDPPPVPIEMLNQKKKEALEEFDAKEKARLMEIGLEDEYQKFTTDKEPQEVKILWADMRDGTFAQAWPEGVYHGELNTTNAAKTTKYIIHQHETVDEDENIIKEQGAVGRVSISRSIHVIGSEVDDGWVSDPQSLQAQPADEGNENVLMNEYFAMLKIRELRARRNEAIEKGIVHPDDGTVVEELKEQLVDAQDAFAHFEAQRAQLAQQTSVEEEVDLPTDSSEIVSNLSASIEESAEEQTAVADEPASLVQTVQDRLNAAKELANLQRLEEEFPEVKQREDRHDEWVAKLAERVDLNQTINSLEKQIQKNTRRSQREPDLIELELRQARKSLSRLEAQYPQFAELDARRTELENVIEARRAEISRLRSRARALRRAAKAEQSSQTDTIKSEELDQLLQVQEEDKIALKNLDQVFERNYRYGRSASTYTAGPDSLLSNSATSATAGQASSTRSRSQQATNKDESGRRGMDIKALKEAGIEVDEPRRGVWDRIKGVFGR